MIFWKGCDKQNRLKTGKKCWKTAWLNPWTGFERFDRPFKTSIDREKRGQDRPYFERKCCLVHSRSVNFDPGTSLHITRGHVHEHYWTATKHILLWFFLYCSALCASFILNGMLSALFRRVYYTSKHNTRTFSSLCHMYYIFVTLIGTINFSHYTLV